MVKWVRVEDGLYQKHVDGVPKNAYIDRVSTVSEKGNRHIVGWAFCWKVPDGYEGNGDYCKTLREAKEQFGDDIWEGDE